MRCMVYFAAAIALATAGCVNVDLGQASKDWADVGKSFADSYKGDSTEPAPLESQEAMPQEAMPVE